MGVISAGKKFVVGRAESAEAYSLLFFFQAEAGIRDRNVTGAQTCAFPSLTRRPQGRRVNSTSWRARRTPSTRPLDRKSVVEGKSVEQARGRSLHKRQEDLESA